VKNAAKRVAVVALGWILVVVGIAALILPGPGLLALFAGVALLATQYEWAERRVEPVRKAALRTAADSVKSWPRILLSALGVAWLVGFGILWVVQPPVPSWWPIDDKWWLVGGWATRSGLGSGILAGAMVVYSFLNFREVDGERPATSAALD
jgi:vacuolar-type H+-ATPase subunit I/STV1